MQDSLNSIALAFPPVDFTRALKVPSLSHASHARLGGSLLLGRLLVLEILIQYTVLEVPNGTCDMAIRAPSTLPAAANSDSMVAAIWAVGV